MHKEKASPVREAPCCMPEFEVSAPQSCKHGDYLLLSGHDSRKEYFVVLGLDGECISYGIVVAEVEKHRSFYENVGEHEDDHVVAVLLLEELHGIEEFFLPLEHLLGVDADDLRYAKSLTGDMEFLEVRTD